MWAFRVAVPGLEAALHVDTTHVHAGAHACTVERLRPGDQPWLAERRDVEGPSFVCFLARDEAEPPVAGWFTAPGAAERSAAYQHWRGAFQHGRLRFAQHVLLMTGDLATCERWLPAVVSHLWTVRLPAALEAATAEMFQHAIADVPGIHEATPRDRSTWTRIGARTRRIGLLKAVAIRLEDTLWRDTQLVGEPGTLVTLLNRKASLTERVDRLGAQLHFAADVYDVATDRLTESAYASREYRVELGIVGLLYTRRVISHHFCRALFLGWPYSEATQRVE
jgi:hypothetical protein